MYTYLKNILGAIIISVAFRGFSGDADIIQYTKTSEKSSSNSRTINFKLSYNLIPGKDTLLQAFNNNQIKTILALNRIDIGHLNRIDTLVIPNAFLSDFKAYSPLPAFVEALKPVDKIIFFAYTIQAFAVYEQGKLVRWGPVSMGKRTSPTPTGLFHTNWKKYRAISTINSSWIMYWYFNLDNFRGVSMHQYDLPGYPASHACIRLSEEDAIWLYNFCDSWILDKEHISVYGTPVIIFGAYAFDQRKPWLNLANDQAANEIPKEELELQFNQFKYEIMQRQLSRDSFLINKY